MWDKNIAAAVEPTPLKTNTYQAFLWWNFLFVGEVFGFVWNEGEFIHLLGLLACLCDVACASPLQEIHDLFKDYEIKYCYVDRNKRTGEHLKISYISILWGT